MKISIGFALVCVLSATTAARAWGQSGIAQPGQAAADRAGEQQAPQPGTASDAGQAPPQLGSPKYETVVRGEVMEDDLVGDYAQPRWTTTRLFPTTRVYVLPPGNLQVEWWFDTQMAFEDASAVRFRSLYELEIGLGHRLQLDLYLTTEQQGIQGPMKVKNEKVELRYAFADWGEIPANPTLYLELVRNTEGPPMLECKLLLGGGLASRVHWGVNLVFERDLGGSALANKYGVTGGVAYAAVDRLFSLGAELKVEAADDRTGRFSFQELSILAGPSMQWRPLPRLHIDLVALVGALGGRENDVLVFKAGMRPLLVVGWEL